MRRLAVLLVLLPGLAFGAASNLFTSPRDTVRLVSAGDQFALEFHLKSGWHIYWSNSGDAGFPPQIFLAPPATADALQFPPPALLVQDGIAAYVLSGDVALPFIVRGAGPVVSASANWLVCSDICVPEHALFTLKGGGGAPITPPAIIPSPFAATIAPDGTLALTGPTSTHVAAAHFFPNAQGMIVNAASQPLAFTATGLTLRLALLPNHKPITGLLELTDPSGATQALAITPTPAALAAQPPYLWLAFLGGLLLNVMPCVFPILAMKALAIARLGGAGPRLRQEAVFYTAGVLASMAVLAGLLLTLRAFGAAAGWGFQFQSPVFVALIAWIFFAAGLSLAGLFELPVPALFRHMPAQNGFFTGALAVVAATPCTAPFMGAALAAALAAPAATALGIFLMLGLGLAAPFLALALIPGLARLIPRPGAWMVVFERVLSLPMFGSFLWLAWVLLRQTGPDGLLLFAAGSAGLIVALALPKLRLAALAALLILPFLRTAPAQAALMLPGAQPYTPARLAALRAAGTPVFIDLTAAWCVTCLVNEATTLSTPQIQSAFSARHVAVLVGDWTDKNPAITALLAANHRDGVPLYLYFAPGAAVPEILPQILDPEIVQGALK